MTVIIHIGDHQVTHGSIVDPVVAEMLDASPRVDVLYSDPPWGDSNMKYWTTLNHRMTGVAAEPLTYEALLDRLDNLIRQYVTGHVFIETGTRWGGVVAQRFARYMHHVTTHAITYKAGSRLLPNILVAATTGPDVAPCVDLSGTRGPALVRGVVMAVRKPGGVVLDPCCGTGYTARAAIAAGMRFRGNELNAARLEQTMAVLRGSLGPLRRLSKGEPEVKPESTE